MAYGRYGERVNNPTFIPEDIFKVSETLEYLSIRDTNFGGRFLIENLDQFTRLEYAFLDYNCFDGTVPYGVWNCPLVFLNQNFFTDIDWDLFRIEKAYVPHLIHNQFFECEIPEDVLCSKKFEDHAGKLQDNVFLNFNYTEWQRTHPGFINIYD